MNPSYRLICSIAFSCAVGIACSAIGLSITATFMVCVSSVMLARLVVALLSDPEDLL